MWYQLFPTKNPAVCWFFCFVLLFLSISWTNADFLTGLQWNLNQNANIFFQDNAFQIMKSFQIKSLTKKFQDFSMTSLGQNPNFQTKKIPIIVFAAHVSICRINYRETQTHTHTRFDQGQPTIQLILLVIELIQEVKTTLVNVIKMGNRFSY